MKKALIIVASILLLSSCSKNPSELACSTWEEKRIKSAESVNYWSDLSLTRTLNPSENQRALKDQDDYIAVLREMDLVGCKY